MDNNLVPIEAEALPVEAGPPPASLFRTDDPVQIVERATAVANALSGVIAQKKLYASVRDRRHVLVEGWTLCGSMLGVFPVPVWTRELADNAGWEARVEARLRDGSVVGAAEAMCTRSEKRWKDADPYAIRSMAQTRATSKALRLPLGFIISLAGYEATPFEEMPADMVNGESRPASMTAQRFATIGPPEQKRLFAAATAQAKAIAVEGAPTPTKDVIVAWALRELGSPGTADLTWEQFDKALALIGQYGKGGSK